MEISRAFIGALVAAAAAAAVSWSGVFPRSETRGDTREPALRALLDTEADRIEELLSRMKSAACRTRTLRTVAELRTNWTRHIVRHAHAERNCALATLARSGVANDFDQNKFNPREKQYARSMARPSSVLAFYVLTDARPVSGGVLSRLLRRIVTPGPHLYLVSLDAGNSGDNADVSQAVPVVQQAKERIAEWIREAVLAHGESVAPPWSRIVADIDVVYASWSHMEVVLAAWRRLLADGVPHWDHFVSLTPSDYPIRSVPWMAAYLGAHGAVNWVESFLQVTSHGLGRDLWTWNLPCAEEPGGGCAEEPGGGYFYRSTARLKPPMSPAREFGGSAHYVLARGFVQYTSACLDGSVPAADADLYCTQGLRRMANWFGTSMTAEELFVQTALFNGPFCDAVPARESGNLHFVAWGGPSSCNPPKPTSTSSPPKRSDYVPSRPGCVNGEYARSRFRQPPNGTACGASRCFDTRHHLLARKFDAGSAEGLLGYEVADELAAKWDVASDPSTGTVSSTPLDVTEVTERAAGVGGWGGACTCPDGQVYQVGDNGDGCGSLACIGGTAGTCNPEYGPWKYRRVVCAGAEDDGYDSQ